MQEDELKSKKSDIADTDKKKKYTNYGTENRMKI